MQADHMHGPSPSPNRPSRGTFVVRVWFERAGTRLEWRASVLDVRSQRKHHFDDPDALGRFLAPF